MTHLKTAVSRLGHPQEGRVATRAARADRQSYLLQVCDTLRPFASAIRGRETDLRRGSEPSQL